MSGRWKVGKKLQVQQRGRPMPFTEEQMRQIYNTNIIDFAVRNGFEIEKSDKATVHVKHNGDCTCSSMAVAIIHLRKNGAVTLLNLQ